MASISDTATVASVNTGRAPVVEPRLQELLTAAHEAGRISATSDVAGAVRSTDVSFVVVPTPTDAAGGFSVAAVLAAMEAVGQGLRERDGFHLVVLTSTVLPGSTGGTVVPALEKASGKTCGVDFGVCYNPEFIALGSVVADLLRPDFILIGESDERSGDLLASLYAGVCENEPAVARMGFANAELTKLAVNTFVTTKISYANMLAELCEQMPGGDVDVVTRAIGLDSRIGGKYLRGATAYGGPCFPRDNVALASFARSVGVEATLAAATDTVNRRQVSRLVEVVRRSAAPGAVVGVFGLAYKPDTYVADESVGVALANALAATGTRVVVHDPIALENARPQLDLPVETGESIVDVVGRIDIAVITTPWPEYRELASIERPGRRLIVVDCWRILDGLPSSNEVETIRLGFGMQEHGAPVLTIS